MAHILLQKWRDFCEGQGQIRQGRPQGTSTTAGACPPGLPPRQEPLPGLHPAHT